MGNVGCFAPSKGASAAPPPSLRATDLQGDHPPWFLDPHAMAEALFPPHTAWCHKDSEPVSNCPLSSHLVFWDTFFCLRGYLSPRWSKLGPLTPFWATSTHRDAAVLQPQDGSEHAVARPTPHRRFTTHTHREWTELLFYYRLKWGLVSSTKLETCYQCHSLFRSQGYNDTTVPSTIRERKTLQHAMQTRRNVILGHQEGKSGNKGVINTWARSTAMNFQVSWAWILQAFPQTSCGPSPEWNPSEPVSCTPAM